MSCSEFFSVLSTVLIYNILFITVNCRCLKNHSDSKITKHYNNNPCPLSFLPNGSLLAASGPFVFFFLLPTLVGIGGSYFFFLSFSWHTVKWLALESITRRRQCLHFTNIQQKTRRVLCYLSHKEPHKILHLLAHATDTFVMLYVKRQAVRRIKHWRPIWIKYDEFTTRCMKQGCSICNIHVNVSVIVDNVSVWLAGSDIS